MAAWRLGIIPGVLLLRWLSRPRRTLTFAWDYHRREGDTMHVYGFTICGEGTGTNAISKSDVRHFRRFVLWYFSTNYDVRHVVLRGERPTSSLPEDSDEIVLSLDNVKRSHDR